jgi:hypothetical protein
VRFASVLAGSLALLACESAEEREAKQVAQAKVELARSDSTARTVASAPLTGLWTEAALTDRLLRAGVAPRRVVDAPRGPEFFKVPQLLFNAGGGEVHAFIYVDSIARRAVSETLDSASAAPRGTVTPFTPPATLVVQNNLIVVITGGTLTNQDRIATTLSAGLPVDTR